MTFAARTLGYLASPTFNAFTAPTVIGGNNTFFVKAVAVSSRGLYVAVGYDSTGVYQVSRYPMYSTSTDGITWTTPARINNFASSCTMLNIAVYNAGSYDSFVAIGTFEATGYPAYAVFDGSNWSNPIAMGGTTTAAVMQGITVNSSGLFVAVGFDNTTTYTPLYAYSSDYGNTWTAPAQLGASTGYIMTSIAVNSSGKFVAVGNTPSFGNGVYATSTNGTTWSSTPTALPSNASYAITVPYITVNSSNLFVATGQGNGLVNLSFGAYTTSTDGSTWTTPGRLSTPTFVPRAITVNSIGVFVTVGNSGNGNFSYASSSNGTTWVTGAIAGYDGLDVAVSTTSPTKFIAVCQANNETPVRGYSSYAIYP